MNILFISRACGEAAGGMERLSWHLLSGFEQDPEVRVRVLARRVQQDDSLFTNRLKAVVFLVTMFPRVLVAARQAEVVHIGDPLLSKIGWFIRTFLRKPVAVTVHGLDVSFDTPLYQLYLKLFFRNFDLYIAISQGARQALEQHNPRGKVAVIPPGIPEEPLRQTSVAELAERLELPIADKVVLATVGRLVQRKGHAWFIEHVMPKLPEEYVYVVAGSGPEEARLAALVTQLNLSERVFLLGRVSDQDLQMLYGSVDAFIQPNIPVPGDVEGFGLVLLEAGLQERVVLAADLEGIRDAVVDGQNGWLVPAQDAEAWTKAILEHVQQGVSNPRARSFILERFSWPVIHKQYKEALQSIK